jgi:enoyl-CoA hydratase
MAYETILYAVDGAIATITINRPKVLNALNPQVVAELSQALAALADDDEIKVAILTGAGGKAFVAGADIAAMSSMTPVQARNFSRQLQEVTTQMEALAKPIIAVVNGFALGGGTEISLACDFIYASESAKFGQPEINLGIIPGAGGTQRLARLASKNWAKELCLTGDIIDVALAKDIGLVNRVFPADQLMVEAVKTAKKIASKGRVSTRACKELINFGYDLPLNHALRLEAEAFGLCFASPDQKEGMGAFLDKRKPEFKGEK